MLELFFGDRAVPQRLKANLLGCYFDSFAALVTGLGYSQSTVQMQLRLGNSAVSVIEAQVGLTVVSDKNQKENFQPVDGEEVLKKIRGLGLMSWNFIGQDPKQFRHYGPMAQEFFAAFRDSDYH